MTVNGSQTVDLPSDANLENPVEAGEITDTYDPTTTTTTTVPAEVAGEQTGAQSGSNSGTLPFTGVSGFALLASGLASVGAGVILVVEVRRRRPRRVD